MKLIFWFNTLIIMPSRQITKWFSIIHSEIKSIDKSKCPVDKQTKDY